MQYSDPYVWFQKWYEMAQEKTPDTANMFSLASVSVSNKPSSRMMLLKELRDEKFIFYTNYESKKAQDLNKNPWAAMTFFWPTLYLQIRILGSIEKTPHQQSATYWKTRPRGSQIAGWTSHQSSSIASYETFLEAMKKTEFSFHGKDIPCPKQWGGYALSPTYFEFWEGKDNRAHQRTVFQKENTTWKKSFLAP